MVHELPFHRTSGIQRQKLLNRKVGLMPYMQTVKTTSGETAVQAVWSWRRGSREIEHHRSAHNEAELGALKAAAQQRMAAGQLELGLGQRGPRPSGPLPVTSSRMSHLADALEHDYRVPEI